MSAFVHAEALKPFQDDAMTVTSGAISHTYQQHGRQDDCAIPWSPRWKLVRRLSASQSPELSRTVLCQQKRIAKQLRLPEPPPWRLQRRMHVPAESDLRGVRAEQLA